MSWRAFAIGKRSCGGLLVVLAFFTLPTVAAEDDKPKRVEADKPIPDDLPRMAAVVVRDEKSVIVSIDPRTRKERELGSLDGPVSGPAFSADGKSLAFVAGDKTGRIGVAEIAMGETMEPTVLDAKGHSPALSPDGKQIAFSTAGDLYVVDRDGANLRNLTESKPTMDADPCWSPDGKEIAFVSANPRDSFRLYAIGADGKGLRLLCDADLGGHVFPDWSADGKRIALSRRDPDDDANRICVLDVETGELTQVTEAPGFHTFARWSPDGRYIAYADFPSRPRGDIRGDLAIVDVETKERWTLLEGELPSFGARPSWFVSR